MKRVIARFAAGATLVLGGLAVLGGGTAASAATPPTVTKTTMHFPVVVGPNNDQHCDVVGDLYVPSTATAATPAPSILTTNGFGGSKDDQAADAALLARRGYVVLSYSGLGFGGSGCNIETDQPAWDGKAASQLISFLGNRPEVLKDGPGDPRIGMFGGSYGGGIQFATASIDPRLDTIVPSITWNDLSYSLAPNNAWSKLVSTTTIPPGTPKEQWSELFFADGLAQPAQHPSSTPVPPSTCPGFDPQICVFNTESTARGFLTPDAASFFHNASVASFMSTIRIPTLLIQGQHDSLFDMAEAVTNMRGISANGATVHLVLEQGGHSGPAASGEYNTDDPSKGFLTQLRLNWFDHFLKRSAVPIGPPVLYFRDWVHYDSTGSAAPAYASAPSWPVGSTRTLFLSGDGSLVSSARQVQPGTVNFANPPGGLPPNYSETSAVENVSPISSIPPTDAPGTFAAFTSAPLPADVVSVGIPTADVSISAATHSNADPSTELVLFGKVYDVAPDGSVALPYRLVSPLRVADLSKPVHINLPGIVHQYPVGHRIRLVLSATDAAYAGSRVADVISVHLDNRAPSTLSLPLLPAVRAVAAPAAVVAPSAVHGAAVAGAAPTANVARATAGGADAITPRPAVSQTGHPGWALVSAASRPTALGLLLAATLVIPWVRRRHA
jgi:ABC-2 type transport system ATP-binding protein